MRNVIAFILAAIMSAAIVFVAALLFFPDEEKQAKKDESQIDALKSVTLTVSQSDSRALLYQFSFILGQEEYSLPCQYAEFEQNGWVLRNPNEKIAAATNLTGVYMKKARHSLKTEIINYSDASIMCCKGQIHCVSAAVSEFGTIAIPGAIICDTRTTPESVRQSLGDADVFDEDEDKITLTYQKSEYKNVRFVFYKNRSFGDSENSGYHRDPFESGYYEHVVIIECRKES